MGVPAPERGCGLADRGKRGSKHHLLVDERGLFASRSDLRRANTRLAFPHPAVASVPAVKG
jgi:hypothetical protein